MSADVVRVSVVIPCFNQARYLRECLDSVLAQSYRDFEAIVVDDGSTGLEDRAILDALDFPQTRVIRQTNRGLAAARNVGIAAARGEYVLPLDCDDLIKPTFLERTVGVLESDPSIGIVGTGVEYFGDREGVWDLPPYAFPAFLFDNRLVCTCLFRKSDWEAVGGYNRNMSQGMEDWDFWISLVERGRGVVRLPDVLFRYRRHGVTMAEGLKDGSGRIQRMKRQIVENHAALYARYPACRVRMLTGRRSLRHKLVRAFVRSWMWAVPLRRWRRCLRQVYLDIA